MQALRSRTSDDLFPAPPTDARSLNFDLSGLGEVRSMVFGGGADAGLSPRRAEDLMVAASELAANSVLHGGGGGTARVWGENGAVVVEVHDAGTIPHPERLGQHLPDPSQENGRGLWIANQLCDEVAIRSGGADGTRVRLRMDLGTE